MGLPVVRGQLAVLAGAVAEQVAGAFGAAVASGQRRLEPGVVARGVVRHQVDDDPDAAAVRLCEHRVEVRQRAEQRVDIAVIGHVVAAVALRRGLERRQPDGVDAELVERGEAGADAGEVAHAVAIRVGEGARVDLVNRGSAPPL